MQKILLFLFRIQHVKNKAQSIRLFFKCVIIALRAALISSDISSENLHNILLHTNDTSVTRNCTMLIMIMTRRQCQSSTPAIVYRKLLYRVRIFRLLFPYFSPFSQRYVICRFYCTLYSCLPSYIYRLLFVKLSLIFARKGSFCCTSNKIGYTYLRESLHVALSLNKISLRMFFKLNNA